MRVLILVHYYFPKTQSCTRLVHDLGAEMSRLGHEVIVAAPDESLPSQFQVTVEDGLTVLRVRSGRFRNVPKALRALNEWRLPGVMWRRAGGFLRGHPCQLIANYSPTIFFGPLARRLKHHWGCPNYLILRDIFPQWAVDAGLLAEGSLAHRIFRHYERVLYETADVIGVQSPRNLDYFERSEQRPNYRTEVLFNWAPADRKPPTTAFRRELGLEEKIVFFYGGNLGVAQDVDNILRLAGSLRLEPNVAFVIAGAGSEAHRLRALAREEELASVHFHAPVDQDTFLGMVSEFDVGLISLNRSLGTHNFPGKMLDYMACGKPILASINAGNDLRDLLETHEAGFVAINGEDEVFHAQALRLARSAELRRKTGENGQALLESRFSAHGAAKQILAHASEL